MYFLKGVAESDSIPNATAIFKDLITESIPWMKLQDIPSARNGPSQNSRQEADNGAPNRESAEHFQHVATNLTSCHSQGLFSELGQIIAKLTAQTALQTFSNLERAHFPFLGQFTRKIHTSPDALAYQPFMILYQNILSTFISQGSTPRPVPPPNWTRRWQTMDAKNQEGPLRLPMRARKLEAEANGQKA